MRYLFAIVALGLLIAFHELGHLIAARLFRIRVDRFSFGFGPPIFSFKRRRIEWVLGAIPLGGAARLHGLNPHTEGDLRGDPESFLARRPSQRLVVLASGSLFNAVLALAVLLGLFLAGTHVPVQMTVGTVEPGSEAARAQLRPGDVIASANGRALQDWSELVDLISDNPGKRLELQLRRPEGTLAVQVTPRADENGDGRIGITQQYVFRRLTLGEAIVEAGAYVGRLVREGATLLWRALRGRPGVDLVSPVILVKQASDVASLGWDAFLRVVVHLSIALAIFYLLPLPSLDGGRMLLTGIEAVRRRPLNPKLETALQTVGFVLLLAVVVLVATNELRNRPRAAAPGATNEPSPIEVDAGR